MLNPKFVLINCLVITGLVLINKSQALNYEGGYLEDVTLVCESDLNTLESQLL